MSTLIKIRRLLFLICAMLAIHLPSYGDECDDVKPVPDGSGGWMGLWSTYQICKSNLIMNRREHIYQPRASRHNHSSYNDHYHSQDYLHYNDMDDSEYDREDDSFSNGMDNREDDSSSDDIYYDSEDD